MNATTDADSGSEALTVEDVALVVGEMNLPVDTERRLVQAVRSDPRNAAQIAKLQAMAEDAGLDPENDDDLWDAFHAHELLDRLLAAEGWEHPAEVLDAENELGHYFRELIRVAEARTRRAEEPGRLLEVRDKIERAWGERKTQEALLASFVDGLLEQEGEVAKQLLKRADREYSSRLQHAEPRVRE